MKVAAVRTLYFSLIKKNLVKIFSLDWYINKYLEERDDQDTWTQIMKRVAT